MDKEIERIKEIYLSVKGEIESKFKMFKKLWSEGGEEEIFAELVFCLLTPQSKAKVCWKAVSTLIDKNLLLKGDRRKLVKELAGVRFKYRKAQYIVEARKKLKVRGKLSLKSKIRKFNDVFKLREWLVQNIKGMGYKEASHFLRNIGKGDNLAILDRHILKNLKRFGLIDKLPPNLSRRVYLEIEDKMREFSKNVGIPMSHLDLVLWYRETGEIFK
jgi:N-glycosylase/DNA lyase